MTLSDFPILVAGGSGQLAESLKEVAHGLTINLAAIGRPDLDICDRSSIDQALTVYQPRIIINAAAYTAVDAAESDPATAFKVNETGPGNLARAANEHDIPIVHVSTDYVFNGTKGLPYSETDPVDPLGVYGSSKRSGEEAIRRETRRHLILRTAWLFSPFGNNFLKTMLRLAQSRDEISVVADQIGNPTYTLHLAAAILDICRTISAAEDLEGLPWGIYHLVAHGEASWADLAEAALKVSAVLGGATAVVRPITTDQYPTPTERPADSRLNTAAIEEHWGITLPDWRRGVTECVQRLIHERKKPLIRSTE